ncbi:helix-turn-helix transcriptional regulator [Paenibacillus sp. FSL R7-0302]|uniref:helix-turn-helix domain-containing protein n=1 Tax=Paenibacillus sp. FSL R7-0302 TaxID=2921681 RepID=UPI0030F4C98B
MEIGMRIKHLRNAHSMSQAAFANQIGILQGTLSEIERSKSSPSVETIISISKEFGVKTDWILRGESLASEFSKGLDVSDDLILNRINNLMLIFMMKLLETKDANKKDQVISDMINEIRIAIYETALSYEEIEILNKYRTLTLKDQKEILAIVDLKQESSTIFLN